MKNFFKKNIVEILIFIFAAIFGSWLMFSTFSYSKGSMLIAIKAWSDFASQIPLIRSFSFGSNFPPQFPLFAGPPIHYHFLFYLIVGLLEKAGVRIDYALNIPSIIGFIGLILIIYFFAKTIFKSKAVALLSILFFIFNGSISFVYFLIQHPKGNILNSIFTNSTFPSFGPYDGRVVSAFWNLNIYTNQRHLALSFFLSLLIILIFILPVFSKYKSRISTSILLGIVFGLSFFLHFAVFLMTVVALIILTVLFPKIRKQGLIILALACIISLPQYLYLGNSGTFKPFLAPNYLITGNLTIFSFIYYWFANLGLHFILIPLGFIIAPKNTRKILITFFSFFVIGHLVQFSPEAAANHKFFNYFMIIGNMFSAFAIVYFWKKKFYLRPFLVAITLLLIFSGIIDFFPIYNDGKLILADYPVNKNVSWIIKNTPPNSTILNSQFLYDPASLAGRKIFLGWPYFAWSAGYDTNLRFALMQKMFAENNKEELCSMLTENKISYIEISSPSNVDPNIRISKLFNTFKAAYTGENLYRIYSFSDNCKIL
jgi:hypothetical protein